MWLLAITAVSLVVGLVVRRVLTRASSTSDVHFGTVSESWLAANKSVKD